MPARSSSVTIPRSDRRSSWPRPLPRLGFRSSSSASRGLARLSSPVRSTSRAAGVTSRSWRSPAAGSTNSGSSGSFSARSSRGPRAPNGLVGSPVPTEGPCCSTRSRLSRRASRRKLLHVLLDGEFEPLGSSHPIPVDVRFVLSTRENLPALVEQGKFRRELYERINDVCLKLPPLRQRGQDIVRLAEHFRERFAFDYAKPAVGFSPDALDLLVRHDWPGNVRELESVIQRGVALSQGSRVTSANLSVGLDAESVVLTAGSVFTSSSPSQQPGPPASQRGAGGAREADHHPGAPGLELEPPGDGPCPRYQPDYSLQEDEEVRAPDRGAGPAELRGQGLKLTNRVLRVTPTAPEPGRFETFTSSRADLPPSRPSPPQARPARLLSDPSRPRNLASLQLLHCIPERLL